MSVPTPIPADLAELAEALGTKPQNTSNHLGVLAQAGIESRRKQGTTVFYAVADASVYE